MVRSTLCSLQKHHSSRHLCRHHIKTFESHFLSRRSLPQIPVISNSTFLPPQSTEAQNGPDLSTRALDPVPEQPICCLRPNPNKRWDLCNSRPQNRATHLRTMSKDGTFRAPETKEERPTCDFCSSSPAILHCRADDAILCLACDRHVHSANTVSSRHPRSLLCDSCLRSPASALCCTHQLLLCANCDFDSHRLPARGGHVRRPVEPFSGCPGAVELMGLLGIEGDEKRLDGDEEEGGEEWAWEEMLNLDELVVPVEAGDGLRALDAPPLPKDRNSSCGKHKEEILRQLREMLKSEFDTSDRVWNREQELGFEQPVTQLSVQLESKDVVLEGDRNALEFLDNKDDLLLWQGDHYDPANAFSISYDQLMHITEEGNQFAQNSADDNNNNAGDVEKGDLISANVAPLASPREALELFGPDRDSAISRYREKRKTRRYDKRVIYESRRDHANTRIRVKGRFVKINRDSEP